MITENARACSRHADYPELATLVKRIESVYHPVDVLLFGSRVKGTASDLSDWDILVLLPDGASETLLDPLLGWETQSGSGVYADVHACFLKEYLADLNVATSLAMEIKDHAVSIVPR